MILRSILVLLLSQPLCIYGFSEDTVYFQTTRLSVFKYYPDVQLFEVTVPPSVSLLQWIFFINLNDRSCHPSLIKFHYQHGGYPLVQENNQTFPADYRLPRTAAGNVVLQDVGVVYALNVTSPYAGRWYAGVYLDDFDNHEVVKKIGAKNCLFSIQMNVSMVTEEEAQEIATNEALKFKLNKEKNLFSFPLEDNIWAYTVKLECLGDGGCPVLLYVNDGGIPHKRLPSTKMVDCSTASPCTVDVLSPRIDQLQYISVVRSNTTKTVHYVLSITTSAFGTPTMPEEQILTTTKPSIVTTTKNRRPKVLHANVQPPKENKKPAPVSKKEAKVEVEGDAASKSSKELKHATNGTKKKLKVSDHSSLKPDPSPSNKSSHDDLNPEEDKPNTTQPLPNHPSPPSKNPQDDLNPDEDKPGTPQPPPNHPTPPTTPPQDDPNPDKDKPGTPLRNVQPQLNDNLASIQYDDELETGDRRKKRSVSSVAQAIARLDRLENPDTSFDTVYSASPVVGGNLLNIAEGEIAAVGFVVLQNKDQGGTLFFTSQLNASAVYTGKENVTVHGCLSPNRLLVNSTSVACSDDFAFSLSTAGGEEISTVAMMFPYPEAGTWYLVMSIECKVQGKRQICVQPFYPVVFEIISTPCDRGQCGKMGGCNRYYTGTNLYSACSCHAKYRGYGCTDDSKTLSPRQQLADTLILVLSNLMFLPSIGVATARKHYTEALVYLANMIFSTLYHACDMSPWSHYRLCVMPYHVLSYCDFFASIMSIWVTLVAAAALSPTLSSLAHMAGALSLAMAVEWHVHGLWHNVVPIAVGVLLIGISWGVKCKRLRHCYPTQRREWLCMLPGLALAGLGFATFAFLETDANYPYTHSAWHVCMALSIVFLLPQRKKEPCHIICDDSTNSSFELDYPSESVNLVPANRIL